MEISVGQDHELLLSKIFNTVILIAEDGEEMAIRMRDGGFEFKYQGEWYSAKEGVMKKLKISERSNILVNQDDAESPNKG